MGPAALRISNETTTGRDVSFTAQVFAGSETIEWSQTLDQLEGACSIEVLIALPAAASVDPRMLGHVAPIDLTIRGATPEAVSGYMWFRLDGTHELLTEEGVFRERAGVIPAHGPNPPKGLASRTVVMAPMGSAPFTPPDDTGLHDDMPAGGQ